MSITEEQILIDAEQKTAQAYSAQPGTATLREWNAAKAALKKFHEEQEQGATAQRFKNIEQAAAWIISEGYIVSSRTIRNHADRAPGFPRRQTDGSYLKSDLSCYAQSTWENPSKPAEERSNDYQDDVKRETARKLKLDNDIKEGRYLFRSEEEQRDALVLYGLKTAVENWGPFIIEDLVSLAASELGEESIAKLGRITPELLARYRTQAANLFDKFSADGFIEVPDAR